MQITVIAVGKLKRGPESDLWDRYQTRFDGTARPLGLQKIRLIELGESRLTDASARRTAEANAITAKLPDNCQIITCDEQGKAISSTDLAKTIGQLRDDGTRNLAIVIGGPDGIDTMSLEKAAGTRLYAQWSFGRITLPHGLARITLSEQLYRATTLLSGHPYHRA